MIDCLIYALECPKTGKVHYVGQTMKGLIRPYSHYASHNAELRAWFRSIETEPVVRILERNPENQLEREAYWIGEMIRRGEPLLNKMVPKPDRENKWKGHSVSAFIKKMRKDCGLTQPELAEKAGVGLRFVRDLEQGKRTYRADKALQVLQLFGATLVPYVEPRT